MVSKSVTVRGQVSELAEQLKGLLRLVRVVSKSVTVRGLVAELAE